MASKQSNRDYWIFLLFCFGLLYSLHLNNLSSAPVDNWYQISTKTNQTKASISVSIQSQHMNIVSVQAPLFAASTVKRKFEEQIQSLSSISMETSSTSTASYHFAAVTFQIKKPRQTKIWVGAPDPKYSAFIDVALSDLIHSNLLTF